MKKKGISLVALVVTIIVLIILTGAVVATFMEGGIIDKSKEAVMKSDSGTLQEAYNVAYNTAKIDEVTGTGEKVNKIEILEKVVNELGLKGFEFNVLSEEVEYTGDNTEIEQWINSNFKFGALADLGYIFSTIDGVTYITGIKGENDIMSYAIADKILNMLGDGYSLEGEYIGINEDVNDDGIIEESLIANGTKILKDGELFATIIVKGDPETDFCVDGSDIDIILSIFSNIEVEKEQLLAADINNDGYISQDDINFIVYYDAPAFVEELQVGTIDKIPENLGAVERYKWHTETSIKASLDNVSGNNMTVPSGTTYKELENDIKEKTGINKITLKASDKNAEIQSGDRIELNIPLKISEGEYSSENSIVFTAVIE